MAQPAKPRPGLSLLARSGHLEYDRVLFFSDAIFAIAITLLVIDIQVPGIKDPALELSRARGNMVSFGISFVVIGLFWMGHHSTYRYIAALDRPLIAINLLFLGIVAFLPYPTSLLSYRSSPDRVSTIFYAVCISCAGLVELAIWLYASLAKDLLVPGTSPAVRRYIALRVARIPLVFLLSIPVALVSAQLASYFWVLVAVLGLALDRFARPAEEGEGKGEMTDWAGLSARPGVRACQWPRSSAIPGYRGQRSRQRRGGSTGCPSHGLNRPGPGAGRDRAAPARPGVPRTPGRPAGSRSPPPGLPGRRPISLPAPGWATSSRPAPPSAARLRTAARPASGA